MPSPTTYRLRNLRTGDTVHPGDESPLVEDRDTAEWILEYEVTPEIWRASSFHISNLNGVTDPKPFKDIAHLLEAWSD